MAPHKAAAPQDAVTLPPRPSYCRHRRAHHHRRTVVLPLSPREVRPLARSHPPLALANIRAVLPVDRWLVQFLHGPRNTDAVLAAPELARAVAAGTLRLRRYEMDGVLVDETLDRHAHFNYQKTARFWRFWTAAAAALRAGHGAVPAAACAARRLRRLRLHRRAMGRVRRRLQPRRGATTSSTASATRGCRCGGATSSRPRSQTTRRRSSWCRWC